NSAGTVVSNFSGAVHLSAVYGAGPVEMFSEDFESTTPAGWLTSSNAVSAFTDSTASQGNRSLLLTGGTGQPAVGARRILPMMRPDRLTFAARSPSSTVPGGAFLIGSALTIGNAVTLFTFTEAGTMGITDSQGGAYHVVYESNRWYHMRFDFDWDDQTLDFYV